MLTTRQYDILAYVLQGTGFVTMSSIASRFKLSTRTVQRELDTIAGYLAGIKSSSRKRPAMVCDSAEMKRHGCAFFPACGSSTGFDRCSRKTNASLRYYLRC